MTVTILYNLFFSFRDGIIAFRTSRIIQIFAVLYILLALFTCTCLVDDMILFSSLSHLLLVIFYVVVAAISILFLGNIKYRGDVTNAFRQIGFYSKLGETPVLKHRSIHDDKIVELHFFSPSHSLHDWQQRQAEIENALDITISQMQYAVDHHQIIVLKACIGRMDFYSSLLWNNKNQTDYFSTSLILGMSMGQLVYNDLRTNPHVLIGGSTGSGKTLLLKHLLLQCIYKDYRIVILDYKGGVDFSADMWHMHTSVLLEKEQMLKGLANIINEMEYRQRAFKENKCANIDDYNKQYTALPRIILACDEVSDLLDSTGLSKDEKELTKEIHARLNTLIRKGRAFGIHLFLATQRPAADVVGGALKNNASCRVAGKSDDVLSRMILDDSIAADLVPKDSVGVFVNQDGIVFKGFVFDENETIRIPFRWY